MKPILPTFFFSAALFAATGTTPPVTEKAPITWTKAEAGEFWKAPDCPKALALRLEEGGSTLSKDAPGTLLADLKAFFAATPAKGEPGQVVVTVKTWKERSGAKALFAGPFAARVKAELEIEVQGKDGARLLAWRGTLQTKDGDMKSFDDSDNKILAQKVYQTLQGLL